MKLSLLWKEQKNALFVIDARLLLVASGVYDFNYITSVEVVNLDLSNQNLVCDPIPDFPRGFYSGTGQLVNVSFKFKFALWFKV